jgi:hypothetical protein
MAFYFVLWGKGLLACGPLVYVSSSLSTMIFSRSCMVYGAVHLCQGISSSITTYVQCLNLAAS